MAVKKRSKNEPESRKEHHSRSIIELWCLRILMLCGGHRKFVDKNGVSSDEVLEAIGLSEYAEKEIDRPSFIKLLRKRQRCAEKKHYDYPETLLNNLSSILGRVSLNQVETEILIFSIMLHTNETLEACADTLGTLDKARLTRALAKILDLSEREVSSALATSGRLAMSGLLKVDSNWPRNMNNKIDLMSGLAENMFLPDADSIRIFANYFVKGHKPKLGKHDFEHVREPYALIKSYLMKALQQKTEGVNILIYGLPGSGKTEMVRSVVRDARAKLYEISMEDSDGEPLSSKERFSAYQLSQQILNREPRSAILFDEIEDVFPEPSWPGSPKPGSTEKKAWINRLLETNQVPAFWLSNKVRHIDPAFLRRFDYVLQMPVPNSRMRRQMFTRYLGDQPVSEAWLARMSANRNLLPAHIEKAAKVANHLASRNTKEIENVLDSVLKGTQEILELRPVLWSLPMATSYSLDYLNVNVNVPALVEGMKNSRRGNICFYGPPGTGKTALGQYMANQMDCPLIVKRASDILSCWLGVTEKNIAAMFQEAKQENAILLLDEADSFLRDRRGADHSWEVTQVNELLVQMENFDGLFICSTNLMDDLDQASLRRFAIKVKFDYLTPEQAWKMLKRECVGKATARDRRAISAMTNLAPGDFAAVKKRLAILGKTPNPQELIASLEEECRIKKSGCNRPIGFLEQS